MTLHEHPDPTGIAHRGTLVACCLAAQKGLRVAHVFSDDRGRPRRYDLIRFSDGKSAGRIVRTSSNAKDEWVLILEGPIE